MKEEVTRRHRRNDSGYYKETCVTGGKINLSLITLIVTESYNYSRHDTSI